MRLNIEIACMVVGATAIFTGIGLASTYGAIWVGVIVFGVTIMLALVVVQNQRDNRIRKSKEAEALEKFGTIKPKDDVICSICHESFGKHYFPYECPPNALFNYKTNRLDKTEHSVERE